MADLDFATSRGVKKRYKDIGNGAVAEVMAAPTLAPITGQKVVTAVASALPNNALVNGVVIKAKSTNIGKVFVGSVGVTTVDNGSGPSYPLEAGEGISLACSNTNEVYVIGTANDVIYFAGN